MAGKKPVNLGINRQVRGNRVTELDLTTLGGKGACFDVYMPNDQGLDEIVHYQIVEFSHGEHPVMVYGTKHSCFGELSVTSGYISAVIKVAEFRVFDNPDCQSPRPSSLDPCWFCVCHKDAEDRHWCGD